MVQLKKRTNNGVRGLRLWLVLGALTCIFWLYQGKLFGLDIDTTSDLDFELASRQSGGFFDDIPSKQWKLLQHIVAIHNNHKFPDAPLTHNPTQDKRKLKYLSSFPAWYQTVSDSNCLITLLNCNGLHRKNISLNTKS